MSATHQRHARLSRLWPRRGEMLVGLFSSMVVLLALLTLSPVATRAAMWVMGCFPSLHKIDRHFNPFRTRHSLYDCGLPVYDLKIKPAQYREILEVVERAKRRGNLTDDLKGWSKAKFIHNGVTRDVKVRVRGDRPNHWTAPRKSWRIRFPKNDPFQGQREINLILLSDPKSLPERYTNAVFRRLGMITLRDRYAVLRINGVLQGVYYQVEHFDNPLLAHHGRPESTVFRHPANWGKDIAAFKEQVVEGGTQAWQMLDALLEYEIHPTPENFAAAAAVTDMDDYLRFVTGTTLFCSDHTAFLSDNHKLYYDSSEGLFYRIPWDIVPNQIPTVYTFEGGMRWRDAIDIFRFRPMSQFRLAVLTDPDCRRQRNRMLWELVRDDSLLELFDKAYEGLDAALWADVMGDGTEVGRLHGLRGLVKWNVEYIRAALGHSELQVRARRETPNLTALRFAANNASGIIVHGIRLDAATPGARYQLFHDVDEDGQVTIADRLVAAALADVNGIVSFEKLDEAMYPESVVLTDVPGYSNPKPIRTIIHPRTRRRDYLLIRDGGQAVVAMAPPLVSVDAVNAVTDRTLTDRELSTLSYTPQETFAPARRTVGLGEFLRNHHQFSKRSKEGYADVVALSAGVHRLDATVVVPEGVTLEIDPGADLLMGAGVSLVCFGPVRAEGREDAPIRITAATNRPWGAVAAVRPGGRSVLRHVHLSGGRGTTVDGILFTGALAVHRGDLTMERCRITDCPAEDALNVKNGAVAIRESYFARNAADGIDLDFITGEVARCQFVDHVGDALDLSGSVATVSGSRIEGAGDKGISVGEKSEVRIVDSLITGSTIGIAIKDRSVVEIDHCTLLGNATSVSAYRKKPIFGGGRAVVHHSILLESETAISADEFSSVEVRACVLPEPLRGTGYTVAAADLPDQLRSHGFVLEPDHGYFASPGGDRDSGQARPGILGPPVEFR